VTPTQELLFLRVLLGAAVVLVQEATFAEPSARAMAKDFLSEYKKYGY
jgi:hypothetical protein